MSEPDDAYPHIRWFGEPWPEPDYRAPVCDDDALRVDVPTDLDCIACQTRFAATDQGVKLPMLEWPTWTWTAYHLECFLQAVLGGKWREATR